jgi:hypothetical protein
MLGKAAAKHMCGVQGVEGVRVAHNFDPETRGQCAFVGPLYGRAGLDWVGTGGPGASAGVKVVGNMMHGGLLLAPDWWTGLLERVSMRGVACLGGGWSIGKGDELCAEGGGQERARCSTECPQITNRPPDSSSHRHKADISQATFSGYCRFLDSIARPPSALQWLGGGEG